MENQMRQIRLSMVTLNIGVGQAGEKVEKAKKLLEKVSGKNAVITKGRKRSTFGVSRGRMASASPNPVAITVIQISSPRSSVESRIALRPSSSAEDS